MLGYDLGVIERGVRGVFAREFITRQKTVKYPDLCTIVDSDKQSEKYSMISTLPILQKMEDERVLAGFSEYAYELQNEVYGTGIKVPRRLFEYDQTGQVRTLVQSLGSRVANFPDKLVFTLPWTNGACYDKKTFFANDHNMGDGTSQLNYITSCGMTNALIQNASGGAKVDRDNAIAIFQKDLMNAKGVLADMCDDRGEPWHEDMPPESLILICHPRLEFYARTAIEGVLIGDTTNLAIKSVGRIMPVNRREPFGNARTPTAALPFGDIRFGTFYLAKVDTPVRPLLFQRFGAKTSFPDVIPEADQQFLQALSSVEIQSIMRTGQNISEFTFFNDEFLFGARTHYSAGYGMWQNMVQVRAADYATES